MDYWIKKPKGERKTFAIMCRPFKKGKTRAVKDERIKLLNERYKEKLVDYQHVIVSLRNIIDELRGEPEPSGFILPKNEQIFLNLWNEIYKDKVNTKSQSKISARNGLIRALNSLGDIDLYTASKQSIQTKIGQLQREKQADRAKWTNVLLRYIGRRERIEAARVSRKFNWLSINQMDEMVKWLPSETWKILAWSAFGTGARFSELFAIDFIQDGLVTIVEQWDKTFEKVETKNKQQRTAPIIPECLEWVEKWLKVPLEEKREIRKEYRGADKVRTACKLADLPVCTFHDLRHSYAIHLRIKGESIKNIAEFIGDTEETTKRHYLRFAANEAVAKSALERLKKTG